MFVSPVAEIKFYAKFESGVMRGFDLTSNALCWQFSQLIAFHSLGGVKLCTARTRVICFWKSKIFTSTRTTKCLKCLSLTLIHWKITIEFIFNLVNHKIHRCGRGYGTWNIFVSSSSFSYGEHRAGIWCNLFHEYSESFHSRTIYRPICVKLTAVAGWWAIAGYLLLLIAR